MIKVTPYANKNGQLAATVTSF